MKRYATGGSRQPQQVSVLTFTNPNYSPSAPDVVAAEKKTFSWQRWKYDRNQERVYDIQVRIKASIKMAETDINRPNWRTAIGNDEFK